MVTNQILVNAIFLLAILLAIAWILVVSIDYFTDLWRRATNKGRTGFVFMALISCLYAGTKPNAEQQRRLTRVSRDVSREARPLQYALDSVSTNTGYSFSAPTNATRYANWTAHGAYQSWTSVDFAPFSFGYGDLRTSRFAVFTGGFVRPTPRDIAHQIGLGPQPMLALQGVSEFWWAETPSGGRILTWNRFFPNCDTNNPVSFQLKLYPSGCYVARSNDVEQVFRVVHELEDVPIPILDLPDFVFVNNDNERETEEDDFRPVVLGLRASTWGAEAGAKLTLVCTSGEGLVRLWDGDGNFGSPMDHFETTVTRNFSQTLYVEGLAPSAQKDDVTFVLALTTADGMTYSVTDRMTVARVKRVNMSSELAAMSGNPPPFEGQCEWTFSPTNSPLVDRHLAIPFKRVVNAVDMRVRDFDVDLSIELEPSDFSVPGENACWYKIDGTPDSGEFGDVNGLSAKFRNPKVGGVYHFGVVYAGSPQSECNLVLPLAGASIEDEVRADLAVCDAAVSNIVSFMMRHDISCFNLKFEKHLFWYDGNGDYLGRPDSVDSCSIRFYNQVNDATGQGAVCTVFGYPIRIAKISNFMTGYAMERMGVPGIGQALAQRWGTPNDLSAKISFDAGVAVAKGDDFQATLSNAAFRCWSLADAKADNLWPNRIPADNHTSVSNVVDYNCNFISPGFLYMRTDHDLMP